MAVLEMEPPWLLSRWLKKMLNPLIVRVFELLIVNVFAFSSDSRETVPAMMRVANAVAASIFRVLLVPSIVIVLVPDVSVEPAPEVSQFPCTVQDADVSVIVPLEPPVIVTSPVVIVAWLALNTPPLLIVREFDPKSIVPESP